MRNLGRVVGVNIVILIILMASIEGGIRLFYPDIKPMGSDRSLLEDSVYARTTGLRPGATGKSMGARFTVTADRFWHYTNATHSKRSWLLLGDSVTMGIGVDPDSTFAGRLSAYVVDSLRVLNSAVIGYSSSDYLNVLSALQAQPDLEIDRVTLFWCLNDAYAGLPVTTAPQGLRQTNPVFREVLYRHVRTYQWLKAFLLDRPRDYYLHDLQLYTESSPHFMKALEDLVEIQSICSRLGVFLQIVVLPYEYQLRSNDYRPQRLLQGKLAEIGISQYDLALPLAQYPEPAQLFLYGDGIHFSETGHELVFRSLTTVSGLSMK